MDADNEGAWCRCDRLLVWVLVMFVLLVALVAGGITEARADIFDDAVEGSCPPGQEYRGYHREVDSQCRTCIDLNGDSGWDNITRQGRRCIACGYCTQYWWVCEGDEGWPTPACVDNPATADEEQDEERVGDILGRIGGSGFAGGNPFGTGGGSAERPLSLFGDDLGAVQADDVVPQVADGDDGFECPAGTTLIGSGDDEGLCRVSDQCQFYGAASGTFPDCTCANSDGGGTQLSVALSPFRWYWDQYALRCVPRERANPGSLQGPGLTTRGGGALWNTVCSSNPLLYQQGGAEVNDYLTQASPEFIVRRGGIEVLRYGSVASLTVNLGAADWALSADEEGDEETFGSVLCSWLKVPMGEVETAFAGFGIARHATRCPELTLPFFSAEITLDVHCYLIGRWLGLIQAVAVIAYSFLGVRYIWGMKGFGKPVQSK